MSLDEYEAFLQVVEQGTVSAAARVLEVPRPTVSRRLARLEERLGTNLVQRGARRVVVTRAGRALYARVRDMLEELRAAEQEVAERGAGPRGLLKVAAAPLVATLLTPLLVDFQRRYPAVALEVRTGTRFAALTAEGFDVAIRAGVLRTPDLVQRRLLSFPVGVYAAPAYLQRHGEPASVAALGAHALLRDHDAEGRPRAAWPLLAGGSVSVGGAFVTDDRALLRDVTLAGHGLALLSAPEAASAARSGGLVPVLPQAIGAVVGLHVVYPERRRLPARTRAFVDAVVAFFAAEIPEV